MAINNKSDFGSGKTILLVDDEKDIAELLAEFFEALGYRVILTFNGDEAFIVFNEEKIDIVITDIRMPKMNGLKLLKHIKSSMPRFPVILMTGFALNSRDLSNIRYSADAYVVKPFDLIFMKKLVEKLLENR